MSNERGMQRDEALLLQLLAQWRQAHFSSDAELMLAHDADPVIYVREGEILRLTHSALLTLMREDLQGATYHEWDDMEPPIIRIADDASLAWAARRVHVRRTKRTPDGNAQEERFVYAGIDTYEKRDGAWVRIANASTFNEA